MQALTDPRSLYMKVGDNTIEVLDDACLAARCSRADVRAFYIIELAPSEALITLTVGNTDFNILAKATATKRTFKVESKQQTLK